MILDNKLFIYWHYVRDENRTPSGTVCYIKDTEGKVVAKATSTVHPDDNFEKRVGRRLAVVRAVTSSPLPNNIIPRILENL